MTVVNSKQANLNKPEQRFTTFKIRFLRGCERIALGFLTGRKK